MNTRKKQMQILVIFDSSRNDWLSSFRCTEFRPTDDGNCLTLSSFHMCFQNGCGTIFWLVIFGSQSMEANHFFHWTGGWSKPWTFLLFGEFGLVAYYVITSWYIYIYISIYIIIMNSPWMFLPFPLFACNLPRYRTMVTHLIFIYAHTGYTTIW